MGTNLHETLAAIDAMSRGLRTGAFFVLDGAVMAGDVAPLFTPPRGSRRGLGGLGPLLQAPLAATRRRTGASDVVATAVGAWRGSEEPALEALGARVFAGKIADLVYPEARELIAAHRRRGHTVVLVSSALRYPIQPLAEALGVDHVLATEAEVVDGRLTGNLAGPVNSGPAQAAAVERFAAAHGLDLARSHAYGSGDDSVPLLSAVGGPHPVNPGKALAAVGQRGRWPVLRFDSRGRPDPETVLRSLAGYGTMVPSMLSGVAVGLLNRDRHEVTEFGVSSWVEGLFAITGVNLDVVGEENLWSHRPAVFIYNHRNNFDPYVAIRLVRRDWGSVAKREIAGPLLGMMQWLTPNVAFIDRSSAEKAVEGLRPVTDLLGRGVSILVAPEGTRSVSGQLGPFKKGPFRMAMEAGVPIVPIVIRNADQVTTREASIIRKGTIDVAVLAPVSVADWTSEDLEKRIDGVRQLFVDTLADWPRGQDTSGGSRTTT